MIAAGRNADGLARALELGADDAIAISELGQLGAAAVNVIVDLVWGEPAAQALEAAAPGARLVQIGQGAGPQSPLAAGTLRSRQVDVLGFANYHASPDLRASVYGRLIIWRSAGSSSSTSRRSRSLTSRRPGSVNARAPATSSCSCRSWMTSGRRSLRATPGLAGTG